MKAATPQHKAGTESKYLIGHYRKKNSKCIRTEATSLLLSEICAVAVKSWGQEELRGKCTLNMSQLCEDRCGPADYPVVENTPQLRQQTPYNHQ